MTAAKLVLLWWLIGAVAQTIMMLRLRQKYGRYLADASMSIVLGRFWLFKVIVSCFFWPLGVYAWFFRKPTFEDARVKSIIEHMHNRCPDCGEPLERHEDLSQ